MKTARILFEELNSGDENVKIEAKRSSEVGKSILETVCAFANEPDLGGRLWSVIFQKRMIVLPNCVFIHMQQIPYFFERNSLCDQSTNQFFFFVEFVIAFS